MENRPSNEDRLYSFQRLIFKKGQRHILKIKTVQPSLWAGVLDQSYPDLFTVVGVNGKAQQAETLH